jgi:peptidoglycan/LPS O-acetylase OafA/YrhL
VNELDGLQSKPATTRERSLIPFRLGNRPALDGLRGASIIGVIALHTQLFSTRSAFIGVEVFFVLSGFLITCLLIQEWDCRRTFSIKKFYLRRVLRLLPALTFMLVTFVVYQWCFGSHESAVTVTHDAVQALFYCRNWAIALAPMLEPGLFGHTWTLSIEEQFYLLWPPALLLLLRRNTSRTSLLCWVGLAIFLSAFTRFILLMAGARIQRLNFGTDTRCDALLLGCAGAMALYSGLTLGSERAATFRRFLAFGSVLALLALTFWSPFQLDADIAIIYFLIPLFALFILLEVVSSETGLLGRVLSLPWLVYLGRISYGLYLWHSPIFLHVQTRHWNKSKEIGVEVTVTAVVVLASYYLLEKPFLKLKRKFSTA